MQSAKRTAVVLNSPIAADAVRTEGRLVVKGLEPVRQVDIQKLDQHPYTPERRQVVSIGRASKPTIEEETAYTIVIGNTGQKHDGGQANMKKVRHTTSISLSGTAATDRTNVYNALISKINADKSLFSTASLNKKVTHGGETNGPFAKGVELSSSSGGKGIIIEVGSGFVILADVSGTFLNTNTLTADQKKITHGGETGGTFAVGDRLEASSGGIATISKVSSGVVWISEIHGTFSNGDTLSTKGGDVTATATSAPLAVTATATADADASDFGMSIRDDAGYYPAAPSPRLGPAAVTIADGFTDSLQRSVDVEAVYQVGEGDRLIQDKPVFSKITGNLESGEIDGPADAVAGKKYQKFVISAFFPAHHNAIGGLSAFATLRQIVYADRDFATFDAFRDALVTPSPVEV